MLSKISPFLIFLSIYSYAVEQSGTPQCNAYNHIISLGDSCQVAYQLLLNHRRQEAFPFDWVLIPFDSLLQFIANDGKDFLNKDRLIFINNKEAYIGGRTHYIEDLVYNIQLLHDFESSPNFLDDYDYIKSKYDRRLNRLLRALNSNENVLFIRQGMSYEQAVLLDDLIHSKYPQLSYTIAVVDMTEEIKNNWGLKRVKNFYLKQTKPWHWIGDNNAWKDFLSQFVLIDNPNADSLDDHENK